MTRSESPQFVSPRRYPQRLLAIVIAATTLAVAPRAEADEPTESLTWDPRWQKFHVAETIASGAMVAGLAVSIFAVPQRIETWKGGLPLDDPTLERMVLGNFDDRQTAVFVGDIFYYGMWAYPVVVDIGVAALAVHQNLDVVAQMTLIDTQSFVFTGLISTLTQKLAGRQRPYVRECASDPDYDPECGDAENRSQSFLSGHTAMAFTGASLVCLHHSHLPLYGHRAADMLACSTAMLGATFSGVARIVAHRHYPSDVLAGAALGVLSGYVLPELIHYRFAAPTFSMGTRGSSATVFPMASASALGLSVGGQL